MTEAGEELAIQPGGAAARQWPGLPGPGWRRAVGIVDLGALSRNLRRLKDRHPGRTLMAVIKGDGYGHGAAAVALGAVAAGADRLGVATVGEGVALREAGVSCPVHVLGGLLPDEAQAVVQYDLIPSVCSREELQVLAVAAAQAGRRVRIHIKVDTGLHRLGVSPESLPALAERAFESPWLWPEGVYTHLACADEGDQVATDEQVSLFLGAVDRASRRGCRFPIRHVAASTVAIERPDLGFEMVRVGIALYGIYPHPRLVPHIQLEPVLTVKAPILQVRSVRAGEGIGYGYTFRAGRDMRVATVGVGFADGYFRSLGNRGSVLVRGKRVPIVGVVSMDHTLVDVTQVPEADRGTEVVLLGQQGGDRIRAEEVASWAGTIADEVVLRLGTRIKRLYVEA